LEQIADDVARRDDRALRFIVAESCRKKAGVVAQDEREESGHRAILNFGHTIGHAIETVAGYSGQFEHGEAVAVGMIGETRLAERLGWIGSDVTARLLRLLERLGLPTSSRGLDPERMLEAMANDKKNKGGRLRFVLPRAIGKVELTDEPSEHDIRAVLASL